VETPREVSRSHSVYDIEFDTGTLHPSIGLHGKISLSTRLGTQTLARVC